MLKQPSKLISKTALKSNKPLQRISKPKTVKRRTLEQKTVQQLIEPADEAFSRYVRLRDSEYSEDQWIGTCMTCTKTGVVAYIGDDGKLHFTHVWNNGHFVARGNFITRYEEENCNLQCAYRCNKMKSGEYVKYKAALKLKYGDDVPARLEALADEFPARTYHFSKEDLLQIIKDSNEQIDYYVRMATA